MQVFEVTGDLIFNDHNVNSRLNTISSTVESMGSKLSNMANTFSNVGSSLMNFGSQLTNSVTKPIIDMAKNGVMSFSDLGEAQNVLDVTFGKNSKSVKDWSKTLLESFGIGQLQATQFSGTMGSIFKTLGFGKQEIIDMSQNVVELSGDLASFKNLQPEEAFYKIRAGILGETEPLKEIGILVDDTTTKHFAMKNGLKENWNELSVSEKAMWRYKSILVQTKDASGDFSNTSESFANRLRVLQGRVSDLGIQLGEKLMPYAQLLLDWISQAINWFSSLDPVIKNIILVFTALVGVIGPLSLAFGGIITIVGGVIGVISLLSVPVTVVTTAIVALTPVVLGAVGAFSALILKSGALNQVINLAKQGMALFSAILKNNVNGAIDILTKKFGLSKEQAYQFMAKALELKRNIMDLATQAKALASQALQAVIIKIKEASQWVYNHRKEIILITQKFIEFGSTAVKVLSAILQGIKVLASGISSFSSVVLKGVNVALNVFKSLFNYVKPTGVAVANTIKKGFNVALSLVGSGLNKTLSIAKSVFGGIKSQVSGVVGAFQKIVNIVGSVTSKIRSIKFPSPPSWFPGFAKGVKNFSGGLALVGEQGPEIVELPRGSNVIPNNRIGDYAKSLNPLKSAMTNNNNQNTTSNVIYLNQVVNAQVDADRLFDEFVYKLKGVGVVLNGH